MERANISRKAVIAKSCVRMTWILPLMARFRETQELKFPRCSATCIPPAQEIKPPMVLEWLLWAPDVPKLHPQSPSWERPGTAMQMKCHPPHPTSPEHWPSAIKSCLASTSRGSSPQDLVGSKGWGLFPGIGWAQLLSFGAWFHLCNVTAHCSLPEATHPRQHGIL